MMAAEAFTVPEMAIVVKKEPSHAVLTAMQKRKLCELKESAPKMTQSKLIEYAAKEFGVTPSMSQVNRMLQRKDEFLNVREEEGNRKRNRGAKWPELEEAVDAWYHQMKQTTAEIPDGTISAKAKELAELLGIRPFSGSGGWLANFKHRQGIRINIMHRETDAADVLSSLAHSIVPEDGDSAQTLKRKKEGDPAQGQAGGKKRGRPPGTKNKATLEKMNAANIHAPGIGLATVGDGVVVGMNQMGQAMHIPLAIPPQNLVAPGELGVAIGIPAPTVFGRIAEANEMATNFPTSEAGVFQANAVPDSLPHPQEGHPAEPSNLTETTDPSANPGLSPPGLHPGHEAINHDHPGHEAINHESAQQIHGDPTLHIAELENAAQQTTTTQ